MCGLAIVHSRIQPLCFTRFTDFNLYGVKNFILLMGWPLQTVKAVPDAAPLSDIDLDERILIHICYSPRRWMCQNCSLGSNITSGHLRPCDFKMGKVLNSLQTYCPFSRMHPTSKP